LRTQIQLTEQQIISLKTRAAAEGISMAELIRRSIDLALTSSLLSEPSNQTQRAKAVAGRFRSGLGDLGVNHDKYLAEDLGK
jgi:hypothetical protein